MPYPFVANMLAKIDALVIHCKPETAERLRAKLEQLQANQSHLPYRANNEDLVCLVVSMMRAEIGNVLKALEDSFATGSIAKIELGDWESDYPTIDVIRSLSQSLKELGAIDS